MTTTAYPNFAAGQRFTAALAAAMLPQAVIKAADESVTSSTTLQNDNELLVAVAANASYLLDGYLMWVGNDTGDIKFAWTFPASCTLHWAMVGPDDVDTGLAAGGTRNNGEWFARQNQTTSPSGSIQYGASTSILVGRMVGTLITGGTAGTLQLQWAQNTSNATTTTVKLGSWMSLRRVA